VLVGIQGDEVVIGLYKVVWTDGYARDTVADRLVQDGMTLEAATRHCKTLRAEAKDDGLHWWKVMPQEHPLWRGMGEFV
jgi:hypothetical protein